MFGENISIINYDGGYENNKMYQYYKAFTDYTFIFKLDYISVLFRSRFARMRKFIVKWLLTNKLLILKNLAKYYKQHCRSYSSVG